MDMNVKKSSAIKFISTLIISSLVTCITMLLIYNSFNKKVDYYKGNILKVVEIVSYDELDNKSYGTGWFWMKIQ